MKRRTLLTLSLLLAPVRGHAQAADRLPADAPDSAPRDDARFSAALLEGMARGEALAQERMASYANIRVIRRQVPRASFSKAEAHYTQALAAERRWRGAPVTQPQNSSFPFLPPAGWTNGTLVLVHVFAHPTRAENGLLPYSLLTNMRDA